MNHLIQTHNMVYSYMTDLLGKRPDVGYIFATVSTTAGIVSFLDLTLKILSIISVGIGITVGLYTLKIQRAKAKKLNEDE